MVQLNLRLHASNFSAKKWLTTGEDFESVNLVEITKEADFCDNLVDKLLACLHCVTKGIYDIDDGFCGAWLDFEHQKINASDYNLNSNGKKNSDNDNLNYSKKQKSDVKDESKNALNNPATALAELIQFVNSPTNIHVLSQFIQQTFYGLVDAKPSSIRRVNNAYLLHLFRVKITYTDSRASSEVNLMDLNNTRALKFADICALDLVSFDQFEYFGAKTAACDSKMTNMGDETRVMEAPALFWLPIICNFSNYQNVKKEYENMAVHFSFDKANLRGQITFEPGFCPREEFIKRMRKYEPITNLVENDNYPNTFFKLRADSALYMPSLIFQKRANCGEPRCPREKFELPTFSDFSQNCKLISKFYEFYGFICEHEFLKNFPQTLPPLKPLAAKTLAEIPDLQKYSRSVHDKIDFNFDNLIQFTLLSQLAQDIQRHRNRSVFKDIELFVQHIDAFEEKRSEKLADPRELAAFVKTYNELAQKARSDGEFKKHEIEM